MRPKAAAKAKGVRVGNVADFEAGKMKEVSVGEEKVLLVRVWPHEGRCTECAAVVDFVCVARLAEIPIPYGSKCAILLL